MTNVERALPQGWTWTTIEECVSILDGKRVPINSSEREQRVSGKPEQSLTPYYGATGQVGWIDSHIFDEELVLLGEDGAPFLDFGKNKAYLVRGKSWVNNHAHVLRAKEQVTSNSWLLHYLNTFDYHGYVTGTTRLKLNQAQMRRFPVPLAPLPEQRRIVAKIEELFSRLDAGVAALKRVQAALKRYKASVLKAACEGRLVPQDPSDEPADVLLARILDERRIRWEGGLRAKGKSIKKAIYDEPRRPKEQNATSLPSGWTWATVEQLAAFEERSIQSGPFGSMLLHSEFRAQGKLVIGIDNVLDGMFSMGSEHRISEEKYLQLRKFSARPNDVLITVMATVGRVCVLPNDMEPAIITKHVYRISPNTTLVNPTYLMHALRGSREVREQITGQVQGQTRPGINGDIVKGIALPLPPLHEQQRINAEIERLSSIAVEIERSLATSLVRASRLRQSVLAHAFSGALIENLQIRDRQ